MARTDSHPDAAREQLRLLRRATSRERFARVCSLTEAVRGWSLRALRDRMPGASESEVRVAWARLLYGERLVGALGIDEDPAAGRDT